jgi:hypothetical protein
MLMVFHIMVYCVFVAAVLIYLLVSTTTGKHRQYRRSTIVGLFASPIGLIVPYLLFMFIAYVCNHSWPLEGIPIIDPIGRVFVSALLLLGPCVGPPIILFVTIHFMKRRDLT